MNRSIDARRPAIIVVGVTDSVADAATLRANLVNRLELRGYADPSVQIDGVSRGMGVMYHQAFTALASAEHARGSDDACREVRATIIAAVPPQRLELTGLWRESASTVCP